MKKEPVKLEIELYTEEAMKQLDDLEKKIKSVINKIEFKCNSFRLKRKDILVVKLSGSFNYKTRMVLEKQLKKKFHRNVWVIDNFIDNVEVANM